jgi:hypothetical protein
MKSDHESEPKSESMRRTAAGAGRVRRVGICACGRPAVLIRDGRHWRRLASCGRCTRKGYSLFVLFARERLPAVAVQNDVTLESRRAA